MKYVLSEDIIDRLRCIKCPKGWCMCLDCTGFYKSCIPHVMVTRSVCILNYTKCHSYKELDWVDKIKFSNNIKLIEKYRKQNRGK